MKRYWQAIVAAFLCATVFAADEPWRQQYAGEDATGDHVIALWQFLPGAETADRSGRGHTLTLRGDSRFVPNGLFGSCLESFHSDKDVAHGAVVQTHPGLTPKGAFTVELWIKPKPEFVGGKNYYLLDKQYHQTAGASEANKDYVLFMQALEDGNHMLTAYLGYGEDVEAFWSQGMTLQAGEWVHILFTYDGAGLGRFFVNGKPAGKTLRAGRAAVTAGPHPLVIGARVGSTNTGFPGFIDQVRIMNGAPAWLSPDAPPAIGNAKSAPVATATPTVSPQGAGTATASISGGRTVFQRMEQDAKVVLTIANDLAKPLENVEVSATLDGARIGSTLKVQDVPSAGRVRVEISVDTSLKPGEYVIAAHIAGRADDKPVKYDAKGKLTITPRPLPHVLPVIDWGMPELSYKATDFDSLKEIGFTHSLLREQDSSDYAKIWERGKPLVPSISPEEVPTILAQMDTFMAAGLKYIAVMSPANWVVDGFEGKDADVEDRKKSYRRINRHGEPYDRTDVCGLIPEVQRFAYDVGVSAGQTFGRHPALDGALIHSEVRDISNPCFHPHDRAAYRAHSGREIAEQIVRREGIGGASIRDFVPPKGIVAEDHPILDYYRWFWSKGDGWNELHTQVHRGLKTGTHPAFWTFNDPAVRCPPRWGSGGEVDVLSQWTYTYPEPPRIGLATDELFAMADGRPGQRVMSMTQLMWYRSQTAPNLPPKEEDRTKWEKEQPDAPFVTISPDHLREAFWLKLSRPVQGIMYHGDSSIGMGDWKRHGGYRYTNPEARSTLTELVHKVAVPFGPALVQIPDPKADVAMLESFTSSTFGYAGTWGWGSGWVADMHQLLQWARLQPRVIYEETIMRDGLDGIRVLVMPYCAALSQSVYDRVQDFQRKGGIIVADQHLAAALTPDILIRQPEDKTSPDAKKAALQALAVQLRHELLAAYKMHADSSDPDVIVRCRRYRDAQYLFAINDKRTFGNYVGHHRLVMEKGLPHRATLSVSMPRAIVHDLLDSRQIPTKATEAGVEWDASFGPGEGRVYMLTPRPIASLRMQVERRLPTDRAVNLRLSIVDGAGNPLSAVIPVKVDIVDPNGAMAEFSGHYGARDGVLELRQNLASNDTTGEWTVRARELASGKTAEIRFPYYP